MVTAVITGDRTDTYSRLTLTQNPDVYDLTGLSWTVQNSELVDEAEGYNDPGEKITYPFKIENQTNDLLVQGGTCVGRVSSTENWYCLYKPYRPHESPPEGYDFCPVSPQNSNGNSAAYFIDDSRTASCTIDRARLMDVWDGIRTTGNEFHLQNVWITRSNDDAWEWDHTSDSPSNAMNGTLTDCFFEDTFAGHSFATNIGSNRAAAGDVFTYTRLLMNTKARVRELSAGPYSVENGDYEGGAPFKTGSNQPSVILNDCMVGVGDVTHDGVGRTERLVNKTIGGSGNYWLNLDHRGRQFPSYYDTALAGLEDTGWTVITDISTAQAMFDARRTDFINAWNGSANVPDAFTSEKWKLRNAFASSGDWLQVYDVILPNNNGFAITNILYRINGGAWVSTGGTTGFFINSGLTQNESANIQIAAVNSEGTSVASDTKSATPSRPLPPAGNTVVLPSGSGLLLLGQGRSARVL